MNVTNVCIYIYVYVYVYMYMYVYVCVCVCVCVSVSKADVFWLREEKWKSILHGSLAGRAGSKERYFAAWRMR